MAKKRTFKGRMVDMTEIARKGQETQALGNMNVNARGDEIDSNGNILKSRDKVVREKNANYSKTSTNASVISSFEDDNDEMVELTDDPKVANKKQQPQKQTSPRPSNKTKQDTKSETSVGSDEEASSTDLDD